MSLFVAIVPSSGAIEDLGDRVHAIRHLAACRDLRWQPADRWHVTMAFLGDVDDHADEPVAAHLDAIAARTPGPSLRLVGSGVFGRQIMWTGVHGVHDDDTEGFADLGLSLHVVLRRAGFRLEHRPWRPHLTLARSRGSDARPAAAFLESYSGPSWPVTELLAVRSQGGPTPVHTVIHRVQLATA
ncbi:MAG: RNA 2',3'-cyclic phosphodiesterase [Actinomycetes bacterium]